MSDKPSIEEIQAWREKEVEEDKTHGARTVGYIDYLIAENVRLKAETEQFKEGVREELHKLSEILNTCIGISR